MGSGTSRSSLTRDECKQHVPEDKWDESWDEFYFADGKTVSNEIAERVWCKAERWAAYILAQVIAEPKDNGVDERDGSKAEDAPVDRVAEASDASTGLRLLTDPMDAYVSLAADGTHTEAPTPD